MIMQGLSFHIRADGEGIPENLPLEEQGIEIHAFKPLKGKPLKAVDAAALGAGKARAPGDEIRGGDMEIDAQLVVAQVIHILGEKRLMKPQGAVDRRGDAQLLLHLADDGLLRRFATRPPGR